MVEFTNGLVGCRVQMKDIETNQLVADTRITAYDSNKKIVKISASGLRYTGEQEVSLLVFAKHALFEYFGNLKRPMIANEFEINIYSGRKKEDRKKQRYEITARGNVTGIVIAGEKVCLRKPIEITTQNVSVNGLLMEAMAGSFEKKDHIRIILNLGETRLEGDYEVVRIQNRNLWTEEYACRRIVPRRKEWTGYDRRKKTGKIKESTD